MRQSKRYVQDEFGNWWYVSKRERIRARAVRCNHCGNEVIRIANQINRSGPVLCSARCKYMSGNTPAPRITRSAENPNWHGGKSPHLSGYVLVRQPNHPAAQKNGYVPEHRLVMEQRLGRYLWPHETVHHKNGIRNDNRPENLELWSSSHPAGQRVEDLVSWAHEILQLYDSHKRK